MRYRRPRGLLALALLAWSCGPEPAPHRGPVVLITLAGVRADVVGAIGGEPGWTPHIDELAAAADWTGTAVTASGDPLAALASLLTGVSPWQHQLLGFGLGPRRPQLRTVAEVLGEVGYHAIARTPMLLRRAGYGLVCGFVRVDDPGSDREIAEEVAALRGAELLWLHLPDADLPYRDRIARRARRRLARSTAGASEAGPDLVEILAYLDPATPLPPDRRDALRGLYCRGVSELDVRVGALVAALRRSGSWDQTLVVLTASHGTEIGEHGQVLYGENLGRATIEVPLVIKLPAASPRRLAEPSGGRVAQWRLAATVAEAVGVRMAPVHAPSLFRSSRKPILSELYLDNGANHFSLLAGDLQLHWTTRFAPAEPEYYRARQVEAGARLRLSEPPGRIFSRLETAFRKTLPLTGDPSSGGPELRLERWTETGVERVDDPDRTAALAGELRRCWMEFLDVERTPEEERDDPPS